MNNANIKSFSELPGTPGVTEVFDPAAALQGAYIDPKIEIPEPPTILKIVSGREAPACTLGNFSLVIGKAKSRKTFLVTAALAAASGQDALCFVGCLPPDGIVYFFDTEQSNFHVSRVVRRVCRLIGNFAPENFKGFGLRKYKPAERLAIIEYAIYNSPGLAFVVIDGIRDLLTKGINDEEEATAITSAFLRWTAERNIHLMLALHRNKSDLNARGHIGTEAVNKAETVLSVTKFSENSEISIVEAEYSRDIDFEPFAFSINNEGLPVLCEIPMDEKTRKAPTPDIIDDQMFFTAFNAIFRRNPIQKYGELWRSLKLEFAKQDLRIGDNRAKEFLEYAKNEEWITKNEKNKSYEYNRAIF